MNKDKFVTEMSFAIRILDNLIFSMYAYHTSYIISKYFELIIIPLNKMLKI